MGPRSRRKKSRMRRRMRRRAQKLKLETRERQMKRPMPMPRRRLKTNPERMPRSRKQATERQLLQRSRMERKKRRSLVDQRQTATRNPPRRRRLLLLGALRERPEARAKQSKCLSFTFYAGGTLFGSRRSDSGLGKVGWSGVGKGMVEGRMGW